MSSAANIYQLKPQQDKMAGLRSWHHLTVSMMERFPYDLSNRQMAILLTVYLEATPNTVKDIAAKLKISKPAISRALDSLSKNGLIKRRRIKEDRRQVHIQRTVKGSVFLSELNELINF